MRILEATFHRDRSPGAPALEVPVARLYCDGTRVTVESLLDPDAIGPVQDVGGLPARLRLLVEASGRNPSRALLEGRSDGWSFSAIDTSASIDAHPGTTRGASFESLSVVLPMWNEEENIRPAVDAARELCDDLRRRSTIGDHEIVIVDDCSTDDTRRMARALAERDDRIRVIHHDQNRQLGGALRTGFQAARGEVVLYTDADLPCDLAEAGKALRMMSVYGADIVSAYRKDRTCEGLRRAIYSHAYNTLVRLLFGLSIRDINFAFKLIRRSALETLALKSDGSFIDAELLVRAERRGLRIVQFGVDYVPRIRGVSSLARPAVILKLLEELVRLYPEIRVLEPASATVVELRRAPSRQPLRRAGSR
jgi:hypothetical protein